MPIDLAKFDPRGFYRAMDESRSMLVGRQEVQWMERFSPASSFPPVLLAFGCAVQHVPHLMLEAVEVFRVLGIDHRAVTGRQFCCGRPFERMGEDREAADRIAAKSYDRFTAYRPSVLVQWCGACMAQYVEVISHQTEAPFEVTHVTQHVARLLRERLDDIPWVKEVPARVLLHRHSGTPQQELEHAAILEVLEMIPGVEYVGPIEPPTAGMPCDAVAPRASGVLNTLSTPEFHQARGELGTQARAAMADTLVTPYHKCQLEWSKLSTDTLVVREWMSLLAEALGVGHEDRFAKYWRIGDPAEIVELARPEWETWGLSHDDAFDIARRHFVPEYAVDVPHCECGAMGCGSRPGSDGRLVSVRPAAPPKDVFSDAI